MKLTDVVMVWEILHVKNTGEISFIDLSRAIDKVVGIKNNITGNASPLKDFSET